MFLFTKVSNRMELKKSLLWIKVWIKSNWSEWVGVSSYIIIFFFRFNSELVVELNWIGHFANWRLGLMANNFLLSIITPYCHIFVYFLLIIYILLILIIECNCLLTSFAFSIIYLCIFMSEDVLIKSWRLSLIYISLLL